MRKKRLCKRLIENILNIKIRKIAFPETEKDICIRRDSKSVGLDVFDRSNGLNWDKGAVSTRSVRHVRKSHISLWGMKRRKSS